MDFDLLIPMSIPSGLCKVRFLLSLIHVLIHVFHPGFSLLYVCICCRIGCSGLGVLVRNFSFLPRGQGFGVMCSLLSIFVCCFGFIFLPSRVLSTALLCADDERPG